MLRPTVCIGFLPVFALSGCFGEPEPDGGTATPTTSPTASYSPSRAFNLTYKVNDCMEGVVIVQVPMEQASRHLPDGFEPADSQGLFDLPVATGEGAFFLHSYNCPESGFDPDGLHDGAFAVYVKPPKVAALSPVDFDMYELGHFTPSEASLELYVAINWTVYEGPVEASVTTQPTGSATANGKVSDEEGEVFDYGVTGPTPRELAATARFWHNTTGGLAYRQETFQVEFGLGPGSCSIRAGSVEATWAGFNQCPTDSTFGLAIAPYDMDVEFHYLAGVWTG